VETQGKGNVLAAKAVETQGKCSGLSREGVGWKHTRQRQCLSREGSGWQHTRQRQWSYQDVLRLEVPMDDAVRVHVLQHHRQRHQIRAIMLRTVYICCMDYGLVDELPHHGQRH